MLKIDMSLSPEEILLEVRKFIPESVKKCQRTNTHEVTKGALILLKNLPAARDAVLEYLRKVFFLAVNRQIRHIEMHPGVPMPEEPIMDTTVPEIHRVLIDIVSNNSEAWASLITNWSLDLLGKLSWHYAKRGNLPVDAKINDYLKHWLSFKTTRTLMDLSAKCIKYLSDSEAENCMNVLTESIAGYSPYFDWVVAHVGSYFPQLIIKKVLLWGLKDFSVTGIQKNAPSILLNSVVDILGHLAASHLYEINDAFLQLFKWSLNENINDDDSTRKQKIATVPYLLKLASLTQLLLKVITKIILKTLFPVRPDVIPRLAVFATNWCSYFDNQPEILIDLTVHLALACEHEAWQIISILLDTSLNTSNVGYHGVNAATTVKNVCREILEIILQQIDFQMRIKGPNNTGIALLSSIKQDLSLVVPLLIDSQPLKVQTAVRLISLLGAQSSNVIISSASFLIRNAQTDFHLAAFVRLVAENVVVFPIIQPEPENNLSGHGYFNQTLEQALRDIQYATNDTKNNGFNEPCQLFKNLTVLLKWENSNSNKVTILQSKFISRAMHSNLEQITQFLIKTEDTELAHRIAKTLDSLLNSSDKSSDKYNYIYSVDLMLKLTKSIVRYFFICIKEEDIFKKQRGVKICNKLIILITSRSSCARILAIRELIENSLYGEPSKYFGAKIKPHDEVKNFSLLHQNHKHGTSVMLAQRHSSVFHAGVIGQGPRRTVAQNHYNQEITDFNNLLLLDTIKACCINDELNNKYPNLDAITMVSLLLVELISPDVMYNGLPWPDEEFTKVTVERDLQIRRSFKDVPLIWTLLELTARHRPALTYCSVLLRAIAATVIANWDLTEGARLINVMVLGQLLPTPLNCLTDVLPILTPHQINTVMKECVWGYMHENVPSPALFTLTDGASTAWRDPDVSTPHVRFTNILRLFILANIAKTENGPVGVAVPIANKKNAFIAGAGTDLVEFIWDPSNNDPNPNIKIITSVDSDRNDTRFNDGKVDAKGRFWAGTMGEVNEVITPNRGSFYRFDFDGTAKTMINPVSISNGLTWSHNNDTFYYIDSSTKQVVAYDFDEIAGEISNKRTIFDFEEKEIPGIPDGMTIDNNGNLWIAVYDGGKVIHIDPTLGTLLRTVELPVSKTTSVAFGGRNNNTLYVTSAKQKLTKEELIKQPLAGSVFSIDGLSVGGRSMVPYKLTSK